MSKLERLSVILASSQKSSVAYDMVGRLLTPVELEEVVGGSSDCGKDDNGNGKHRQNGGFSFKQSGGSYDQCCGGYDMVCGK